MKSVGLKVSVLCLSYNQKKYVRQTLDSILSQKTKFNYEILINDDASDDGTLEIIKKYQKKYPDIIKLISHPENLYSKGYRNMIPRFLLPIAQGQYLAVCECDDYWTDVSKLQRQVDFLDRNPSYSVCFHRVRIFFEDGSQKDSVFPAETMKSGDFTIDRLISGNFIQTNSVMYRKQKYENLNLEAGPGDWYMHLYHAQFGKIGFINKVMSAYRRHEKGIWWNVSKSQKIMWEKTGISHLTLFKEVLKMFPKKQNLVTPNIFRVFRESTKISQSLLEKLVVKFPKFGTLYIRQADKIRIAQEKAIGNLSKELSKRNEEIEELRHTLSGRDREIVELKAVETELAKIKRSRSWKIVTLLRNMKNRIT